MLRIVILTREEPFFVPIYLNSLAQYKIEKIFIDSEASPFLTKKQLYKLSGFYNFLKLVTKFAIYKLCGKTQLRRGGKYFYSVQSFARYYKIDYKLRYSPKIKDFIYELQEISPDLILSIANRYILPTEVLSIPKYGCINAHSSVLPGYKGVLMGFWHLLNQEKFGGVSIHLMSEIVDEGGLLGQKTFNIDYSETVFSYYQKAAYLAEELLVECLNNFQTGKKNYIEPPLGIYKHKNFFCKKPKENDISKFIGMGLKFYKDERVK